jgi:NAD+ synthase (glutamine-hydrolysing)
MRLVKIAAASLNPTVGAVRANAERIIEVAHALAADLPTVLCFPEQALGGYPPEDLVQWRAFIAAQRTELERIAQATSSLPTILALGLVVGVDGFLFNTAALLHRGRILGFVPKEELPTYEVFYEARTLASGRAGLHLDADGVPLGDQVFSFDFGTLALEVCEDAWSPDGPMRRRAFAGAELILNLSASPFRLGVVQTRRELLATRSADNQATLVYVNRVGGQDGLVFDGGAYIFQNGRLLLDAPRLTEGYATCVLNLDRTERLRRENTTWRRDAELWRQAANTVAVIRCELPTADRSGLAYPATAPGELFLGAALDAVPGLDRAAARDAALDELFELLALGVADYVRKVGTFTALGIALSGGRDSLLTLLVAWRARARLAHEAAATTTASPTLAPPPTLHAFYLPSRYSLPATAAAARTICRELGVPLTESPIDDALERELDATRALLGGAEPGALTRQNIQARIRAARIWNWANSAGALFLQTGDMSEKAVGYTTIGGDLEGGFAPLANLPKTMVSALLERLHTRFGFHGIARTLATEASPELGPAQRAETELMPYPNLDACLYLYAVEKLSVDEVAATLPALFPDQDPASLRDDARRFADLFTHAIYKWVQAPLSLHIGALDLDRERALQLPVVQQNEWGRGDDVA